MPYRSRWLLGFFLLLCSACGGATELRATAPSASTVAGEPAPAPPAEESSEPAQDAPAAVATPTSTTGSPGTPAPDRTGPLLTYQATLVLAVYEVDQGLDAVEAMARSAGGYLVSRSGNAIVVRLPATAFDANLQQILALGDVLQRDLQVEDVTAKVRDLEARLQNAEAVRRRLTELLSGAVKTEDALAVERELARVTESIERMKADLKRIRELVAYSTVTVRFEAPHAEALDRRFKLPFPWLNQLGLSHLLSL